MCLIKYRSGAARSALTLSVRRALATFCATPLLVAINVGGANVALAQEAPAVAAQDAQPASPSLQEVVVSGSRIQRDGYNSPTPVSVVSAVTLQGNATSNVADALNTMPNFAGSSTPQTTAITVTSGQQAINGLNIGGLGTTRTLVLINGQRTVGSTLTGVVDVSELPQQLISRVDVVTGGASAGYGSDALTGIVNFVLDTKFQGLKAEVSGGETSYHDDKNWRANITAGTSFFGGRGHVEVSGEMSNDDGVLIAKRPWNNYGIGYLANQSYTKDGLHGPQNILTNQIGVANASYGGTIASGPFRGTMFGPGGTPFQENFGSGTRVTDPLPLQMAGGSWQSQTITNVLGAAMTPSQRRQNAFARGSFDITDDTEVYVQASYGHMYSLSDSVPVFYPGNLTLSANNAFLPSSIAQEMANANVTSFKFGTFNGDLGVQHPITDRQVKRFLIGGDGKFSMFHSDWSWDAYASFGQSLQQVTSGNTINVPRYMNAINAVKAPDGSIVCKSTLTNPNDGCVPLNLFGRGVASQAAIDYVIANPYNHAQLTQKVVSANLHGSPFNDWAGPVSFAFGVEHRREETSSFADAQEAQTGTWFLAAGLPYSGAFAVSEGYIETNIPLLSNVPGAQQWDLNAAVRETGYNTFGLTRTWKVGTTWSPTDDVRFRATRSLDIREPTLVDLYQAGTTTSNSITDPNNNQNIPYRQTTTGNPNLVPERANNTVLGVVYQPSWLPRFSASFDYYIIDITGGITTFTAQQLYNLCIAGDATACSRYTGTPATGLNFTINPLNFATQHARRFEVETSYRLPMDEVHSGWKGNLAFHGGVTHYISDLLDSGAIGSIPQQYAGENSDTLGLPSWKYAAAFDYSLNHYELGLTLRGLSAGVYSQSQIQCTSICPANNPNHLTVSDNHIAGAWYLDLQATYHFNVSKADGEVFFNVRNVLDRDPPIVAQASSGSGWDFFPANQAQYDILGRVMRLGVRFQL